MIISFDQSPEDFFRLSQAALDKGDLKKALVYCNKATEGKGSAEYKLALADIYLRMGRYNEAMDAALEVISAGGEGKSAAYEIMARAAGALGKLYEAVYYITRKARLDGDDAALDAMDEMMEEMGDAFSDEPSPKSNLFLVGKEPKKDHSVTLDRALHYMHMGDYKRALLIASEVESDSPCYDDALDIQLKCLVKMGDAELTYQTAKIKAERDPKDAFALYVLIAICDKKEYLPLLAKVDGDPSDLYYAVAAANAKKDHPTAALLAEKLLAKTQYAPEAAFVAAGVYHNAKDKEKCAATLKEMFSVFKKFPAAVILDGLKRKKRYDVMFGGPFPEVIIDIMRDYVRKGARTTDAFLQSMLGDRDFRLCLALLYEAEDEEVVENTISFMGQLNRREINRFFENLLLKTGIGPVVKQNILAELLLNKHKGKLTVAPGVLPLKVPCAKPQHYAEYPFSLKEAYVDVLAFASCVMDSRVVKGLGDYTEKCFRAQNVWKRHNGTELSAALCCLLMPTPPAPIQALTDDMPAYLMAHVFHLSDRRISAVKKLMARISALE